MRDCVAVLFYEGIWVWLQVAGYRILVIGAKMMEEWYADG